MSKKFMMVLMSLMLAVPILAWAGQEDGKNFLKAQRDKIKAHVIKEKNENQAVRESMKGKTAKEKKALWNEQKDKQYAQNQAFREKIHQENQVFLKAQMDKNNKLSEAQKKEFLTLFDSQYQDRTAIREEQYNENVVFFDKIANDDTMTSSQKKDAIKAHFVEQKDVRKKFSEGQKEALKNGKEKVYSGTQLPETVKN
ncbi:MAG: hypothetical protein HQL26_02075 [Candidatus Omnitrophica bacterium]|nr:hypothetical protein [Candidatus Omnitrophota bacterium]